MIFRSKLNAGKVQTEKGLSNQKQFVLHEKEDVSGRLDHLVKLDDVRVVEELQHLNLSRDLPMTYKRTMCATHPHIARMIARHRPRTAGGVDRPCGALRTS
jgi:hypothetical protein